MSPLLRWLAIMVCALCPTLGWQAPKWLRASSISICASCAGVLLGGEAIVGGTVVGFHVPAARAAVVEVQSERWEQSRQKRTVAIKAMEQKGMLKVNTDDAGNQFLSLPWIPNRKVPYKTLSLEQRLVNEVCAGAFGEISKDVLLHSVDTSKTRRQAQKKQQAAQAGAPGNETAFPIASAASLPTLFSPLAKIQDLYSGFPVVLASSIPQGGVFFLVKKGIIESISYANPALPATLLGQAVPIGIAVMAYWLFRTPAEVLKTQVQTGQLPTVSAAIEQAKIKNPNGLLGLWKYYPVMLCLDIPFQVVNFILFGSLSDAVSNAGYSSSIWTRLFCGTTCGMISAGLTCPIDVCKTRIISRDKAAQEAAFQRMQASATSSSVTVASLATATTATQVSTAGEAALEEGTLGSVSLLHASPDEASSSSSGIVGTDSAGSASGDAADATQNNSNVLVELLRIAKDEGLGALFLGLRPRLAYTGLANGIRLAAYGTSRMDLAMRSLDEL